MSRSSIALSNLRAVVIVIVLAFHSALAYLAYAPDTPYPFSEPPYLWQVNAIIDSRRWFGFDLFCAWQDVSLMSLMFFLSGLFVPGSLNRKGSAAYVWDRVWRIGVPFAIVVALLMPITYYPTYRTTAADPSLATYWQQWLALPFWPCGPQWFLWQLFALNLLAAAAHRVAPGFTGALARVVEMTRERPLVFFAGLAAISATAYIPLALIFTPWDWWYSGPFSLQTSRILHYLVYFFAGYALGAYGLDRGLLACDGSLARRWHIWAIASLVGWCLWAWPTSLTLEGDESLSVQIAAGVGYCIACATGCLALLAACLRFAQTRTKVLDSLSVNAYGMYLVHYVFVVWMQYALLGIALFAVAKMAIVFGVTLLMSWLISSAFSGVSFGARLAGAKR
jgi:hypothetical protein